MLDQFTTLQKVGLALAGAVVLNGAWNMHKGKPFLSLGSFGDSDIYEYGGVGHRSKTFRRQSGTHRLAGLSSHQVRFGRAAKACGGRGYNQKQFRSCMSKSL